MTVIPIKDGCQRLPMSAVLTFGKYKGRTIDDVSKDNPAYIKWCVLNVPWFELDDNARKEVGRRCRREADNKMARMEAWAWGVLPRRTGSRSTSFVYDGRDDDSDDPDSVERDFHDSFGGMTDDDMRNDP